MNQKKEDTQAHINYTEEEGHAKGAKSLDKRGDMESGLEDDESHHHNDTRHIEAVEAELNRDSLPNSYRHNSKMSQRSAHQ